MYDLKVFIAHNIGGVIGHRPATVSIDACSNSVNASVLRKVGGKSKLLVLFFIVISKEAACLRDADLKLAARDLRHSLIDINGRPSVDLQGAAVHHEVLIHHDAVVGFDIHAAAIHFKGSTVNSAARVNRKRATVHHELVCPKSASGLDADVTALDFKG